MRHFDPDELPDWNPTPDDEDLPDVSEPDTGFNPNHEDDEPLDEFGECYCHNGHKQNGTVCMYCWNQGRRTWEDDAQAVRDGDKQAIGEDLLVRADHLKSEMKDRGEW